jgi:hypothetical protein
LITKELKKVVQHFDNIGSKKKGGATVATVCRQIKNVIL